MVPTGIRVQLCHRLVAPNRSRPHDQPSWPHSTLLPRARGGTDSFSCFVVSPPRGHGSCVVPLFVTCIAGNGSMMCGRYDYIEATGLDFIFEASHIEDEAFPPPIHMLVVDQRGEARHVRVDRTHSDPCL